MRRNPAQGRFFSSEKGEQACVVHWLRLKRLPFIAHMTGIPLHGDYALINALKQAGCLQAGIPDIQIPLPSGPYHSLWIELKKEKGGKVSPEQQAWLSMLERHGHKAVIASGAGQAIEAITQYLKDGSP